MWFALSSLQIISSFAIQIRDFVVLFSIFVGFNQYFDNNVLTDFVKTMGFGNDTLCW